MNLYAGDGRKTPKYVQNENQGNEKFSLPSELSSKNMFRLDESIFGGMVGYVPITDSDD